VLLGVDRRRCPFAPRGGPTIGRKNPVCGPTATEGKCGFEDFPRGMTRPLLCEVTAQPDLLGRGGGQGVSASTLPDEEETKARRSGQSVNR